MTLIYGRSTGSADLPSGFDSRRAIAAERFGIGVGGHRKAVHRLITLSGLLANEKRFA